MDENVITRAGYNKMVERLKYLTTEKRDEVAEKLTIARGFGDLRENAEYDAARTEQAEVEAEILDLEDKIKNAKIVDVETLGKSQIGVGNTVVLYDEAFEEEAEYQIVGTSESDPLEGSISYISPLGKALIGKKVGDKIIVEAPNGDMKFKVLKIK